ncbi:MAG: hypothetical protein ACO1PZ_04495 [Gammaproteobacteria bacterium]
MNMSNKVVPAALALAVASMPLIADTEFGEEVPREVVEQFIGNMFGGEPKLYSDIFTGFPPFTVPAAFEIVASADQGIQQNVILRTTLDDAEAIAAIAAALVAEGWMEMPIPGSGAPRRGFVSAQSDLQPVSLCSDALGRMSVRVRDGGDARYVNLARTTMEGFGGSRRSCAEEAEMMSLGPQGRPFREGADGVRQYMPELVMPVSDVATRPQGFLTGGRGGSSDDFEERSSLSITWSSEALMAHFAEQIVEQGWQPDTQVSSTRTAFRSWTKTVDGNELLGTLTLVETSEDNWDLKFRIVRGGGATVNAGGDFVR